MITLTEQGQKKKTQTVFDGSVAKVKKAPVPVPALIVRTEEGLPLKKYKFFYRHIIGPNGLSCLRGLKLKVKR